MALGAYDAPVGCGLRHALNLSGEDRIHESRTHGRPGRRVLCGHRLRVGPIHGIVAARVIQEHAAADQVPEAHASLVQHQADVPENPPGLCCHIAGNGLVGLGAPAGRSGDKQGACHFDPPGIRELRRSHACRSDDVPGSAGRHHRDLDQGVGIHQIGLHRGTGRRIDPEICAIDPVHGLEVAGVPQKHVRDHHIGIAQATLAECLTQTIQRRGGLILDAGEGTPASMGARHIRDVDKLRSLRRDPQWRHEGESEQAPNEGASDARCGHSVISSGSGRSCRIPSLVSQPSWTT